jgi:hypothetical protein
MLQGTDSLGCSTVKNLLYSLQVQTCDVGLRKESILRMTQVQIFPNPCTEQLHISLMGICEGVILTIFDLSGRIVLQTPLETEVTAIQLGLPAGIYLCEIKNSSGRQSTTRLAVAR